MDRDRGRRDSGDARREPVHVVDEIQGVGDRDHPEQGDGEGNERMENRNPQPEGDRDERGDDLADELGRRTQAHQIVGETQRGDHERPGGPGQPESVPASEGERDHRQGG